VVSEGTRREAGERGQQVGRPIEAAMAQPGARETGRAGIQRHAAKNLSMARWSCGVEAPAKPARRPQVEVEQAVAEAGLVVVVALGLRGGDDFDLPLLRPKPS